ncbi:hypothetical protein Tco_0537948 [Tanacetum coccineum]
MHLKHHEKQIEDILNYLEELSFHRIKKMEEGHINDRMIKQKDGNELKTELKRVRSQITKLQRKQLGQRDKITFAHFRIFDLEQIIEEIQARHQTASAMTQAAIRKLVADSVTSAMEAQAATMANTTPVLLELLGLPKSIKGNVTASKPQNLEEATNKAQRISTLETPLEDIPVHH